MLFFVVPWGSRSSVHEAYVNFDKLYEVYASDSAKGGSAKGPGEEEIAEGGSTVDAET